MKTLVDIIADAANSGDGSRIVHVTRDGSEYSYSYADLLTKARATLSLLQHHGVAPGERLVMQISSESRQLEVFWACVLGGVIPVLLPKVTSWRRDSEVSRRLAGVCRVLVNPWLLEDQDLENEDHGGSVRSILGGIRSIVDVPETGDPNVAREHAPQLDDLAYLQFSSGSTGLPKGVRLTHRNLIHNLHDIITASNIRESEKMLNWMPYFHDMGLVGFHLVPTLRAITQIKIESIHFISDPLMWLRKISEHRVQVIGAPNFALRHVVEKITEDDLTGIDLSSVRVLYNGAEPISAAVMRRFISLLEQAGLSRTAVLPVYGMAEACVAVTLSPLNCEPLVHQLDRDKLRDKRIGAPAATGAPATEYVDVGFPISSVEVRVASEAGVVQAERKIGEIQIRGASVTSGYEGTEENVNKNLFTADGWLRTGDLGFCYQGRLTVSGRIKDVIFINGRNVMAADLESALAERFQLNDRVVACGLTDLSGQEQVVIFVGTRAKKAIWSRLIEVRDAAEEYLAARVECALPIKRIPRTSSGKVQRFSLVRDWLNGSFDAERQEFQEAAAASESANKPFKISNSTAAQVQEIWAKVLHKNRVAVGLDDPFIRLGGTSITAVEMLVLLEEKFGREFGYALLLDCRTVQEVATFIDRALAASRVEPAIVEPSMSEIASSGRKENAVHLPGTSHLEIARIAVIGMAGRFPGAAALDDFWKLLASGASTSKEVPNERWRSSRGKFYMSALSGIDEFAADFFNISDEEATILDPQQRLMLEVAYQALDDAGYNGSRIGKDRLAGIYLGVSHNSYLEEIVDRRRHDDFSSSAHEQLMPANLLNMVAARIAHTFNLKGPALVFDTACSSSLVAIHQACNDLLLGECDLAIAGGANLMLTATGHELFAQASALSPDGVCRVFDKDARGMAPGEGLGVIVLKRLDRALAEGDRIAAVISGIAINNDGRSIGIMAPTPEGQEAVIRRAQAKAGVQPSDIAYIEAHGTGTPIGDPIEIRALNKVFSSVKDVATCGIGSVKTNIGHLLAAAGIAGVIKVLLSLQHEQLPPTVNLVDPDPRARFGQTPLFPVRSLSPWPRGDTPRYAGVSAFGFGGTNAHLVMRDFYPPADNASKNLHGQNYLLCLSARNSNELVRMRSELAAYLQNHPETNVADLCFTRSAGRQQFRERQYFVVSGLEDAISQLEGAETRSNGVPSKSASKVAFLIGSDVPKLDWVQRVCALYPSFHEAFKRCAEVSRGLRPDLDQFLPLSSGERLNGSSGGNCVFDSAVAFSFQYALVNLWLEWGISPAAISGRHVGQWVAACIAGTVSLEDALRIVLAQASAPSMESAAEEFDRVLARVSVRRAAIPLVLNPHLDGRGIESAKDLRAWIQQPVDRDILIRTFQKEGIETVLELSKERILAGAGATVVKTTTGLRVLGLNGNGSETPEFAILHSLGELWREGHPVDWSKFYWGTGARIISAPSYPFSRGRYWLPPRQNREFHEIELQSNLTNGTFIETGKTRRDSLTAGRGEKDWFYKVGWSEISRTPGKIVLPKCALVWGASNEFENLFCSMLSAAGCEVIRVHHGPRFSIPNDHEYIVRFSSPDDYAALFDDLNQRGLEFAICDLRCFDPQQAYGCANDLGVQAEAALEGLLLLSQQALERHSKQPFLIVTSLANSVSSSEIDISPVGASIWSFAHCLHLEAPWLDLRCMDLEESSASSEDAARSLMAQLSAQENNRFVAFRGKSRFSQKVEQIRPEWEHSQNTLPDRGTFVIAGGMGGIGIKLAEWLARRYNPTLILIGRNLRSEDAARSAALERLRAAGAKVHLVQADIADAEQIAKAARKIAEFCERIDVVFHAAGVLQDVLVAKMSVEVLRETLRSKTHGSLVLYEHLRTFGPQRFVFFSSLSAVTGNFGQAGYAAANGFEQAFSQRIERLGQPSLAVNWGYWGEDGAVATPKYAQLLARQKVFPMATDAAFGCLETVFSAPEYSMIIANVGDDFFASQGLDRNLSVMSRSSRDLQIEISEHQDQDQELVQDQAADLITGELTRLGVEVSHRDEPFSTLGVDSMVAIDAVNILQTRLQVSLPQSLLFEQDSVNRLAAFLAAEHSDAMQRFVASLAKPKKSQDRRFIEPVVPAHDYELSHAQKRLWFMVQLAPGNPFYNLSGAAHIHGELNVPAFKQAFQSVVAAQESLRTRFIVVDREPRQVIDDYGSIDIQETVLPSSEKGFDETALAAIRKDDSVLPFDLHTGPLARVRLLRVSAQSHVLIYVLHHIITDGWSLRLMMQQMATAYNNICAGRPVGVVLQPIQYKDYAAWQNKLIHDGAFQGHQEYWLDKLAGELPILQLPSDLPRPTVQTYQGGIVRTEINRGLADDLMQLAARQNVTMFMVLLAGVYALLHRITQQSDLIVGTTAAARTTEQVGSVIGVFVNALALRINLQDNLTGSDLLQRIRQIVSGALAHQDFPFDRLVEILNPTRDLSRPPVFNVMLTYQAAQVEDQLKSAFNGLTIEALASDSHTQFDLEFFIKQTDRGLWIDLVYNTDILTAESGARFLDFFTNLMRGISANPQARLSQWPILSDDERHRILVEWNGTVEEYGEERWVHEMFEDQVERTPDRIAVVGAVGERVTYEELNRRSNQLGRYLKEMGVGPEVRVGVCMERGVEMMEVVLGVMKAGGAYVPLEGKNPGERLGYMVEDSGVGVVVTEEKEEGKLPASWIPVVKVDGEREKEEIGREREENLGVEGAGGRGGEESVYVMYTSGSTGKAKGVVVEHRQVRNYLKWAVGAYGVGEEEGEGRDGIVSSSLGFDATVTSLYVPLVSGGAVHVVKEGEEVEGLERKIREVEGGLVKITPGHLEVMGRRVEEGREGREREGEESRVGVFVVGGEALGRGVVERWKKLQKGVRIVNEYGPTETVVGCVVHEVGGGEVQAEQGEDEEERKGVPIGKPIGNTQIYILDKGGEPVGVGVLGELYIGGVGVTRGYQNRAEQTAERYVPNPFSVGEGGKRMYRTGDVGRWKRGGEIEYVGRNDEQVKIRGYRIELGEIEGRLKEHEGIGQAVVVAREEVGKEAERGGMRGEKRLVAYYTVKEKERGVIGVKGGLSVEELRVHVAGMLPEYMVPTAYVELEEMPLTANGKVDRKKLPEPGGEAYGERGGYEEPEGETEKKLAAIWAEVLKVDRVGRHENFFDLGGHSLLAVQVITRIRQVLGVEVAIREMFAHPVLRQLAQFVATAVEVKLPAIERVKEREHLPLSYSQQRLWFLDQLQPNTSTYNVPYAMRLKGFVHLPAMGQALSEIVKRHEVLRTSFLEIDEKPVQVIHAHTDLKWEIEDLEGLEISRRETEMQRKVQQEMQQPFDLTCSPLLRARVLRLGVEDHVLIVVMHHIVSDGWSEHILLQEFSELYAAFSAGSPSPLPELPLQYGDFAVWQRKWLQGEALAMQLEYWKKQLDSMHFLQLPTDNPRSRTDSYAGRFLPFQLTPQLTQSVKQLSKREDVTLFMTLTAAFHVMLGWYANQDDVITGTDAANRNRLETEGLIGFFVNQLVLRTDLSGNPTFSEVLKRVCKSTLEAYANQDLPFEKLVEALAPDRTSDRLPLFGVKLVLQNTLIRGVVLKGLQAEPLLFPPATAKYDLLLTLAEESGVLHGVIEYRSALFKDSSIELLLSLYPEIFNMVVDSPDLHLNVIQERLSALRDLHQRNQWSLLQGKLKLKLGSTRRKEVSLS